MSDKVEFIALSEKYFQNLYFCQALDQREKVVYVDTHFLGWFRKSFCCKIVFEKLDF